MGGIASQCELGGRQPCHSADDVGESISGVVSVSRPSFERLCKARRAREHCFPLKDNVVLKSGVGNANSSVRSGQLPRKFSAGRPALRQRSRPYTEMDKKGEKKREYYGDDQARAFDLPKQSFPVYKW